MTLEIVPGSLTSPDPSIKNYAPYAPAIGVTGYTDRWRPALDFAVSAVGDAVTTYPSPLMPDNILVGDTTNHPVIVEQSGIRMVDCATPGALAALTDINRKFGDVSLLAVWYEVHGSESHSILTIGGLRFSRAGASWGLSKMSGAAGATLSISNDPAVGGVAISARRYAAILTIPADGTAAVTLQLIGAGTAAVTKSGVVTRGGSMDEQRRLRFGKDSGGSANTGPQFAEMVIWERILTTDEIVDVATYATSKYTL
ncbi:hypothetical protein AAFL38_12080 [Klebsiella grimontii]|uniref:LamG domain-containing protein n=1 Tax=Klebsiella grimontii TaxID=2058152 RepID=A0ABU9P4I5_9ENTR|nr:hypothetical protein [Klebsiella grimontii]MDU1423531.1 hypothetical protein [Klebsiella michiganensis]MDU4540443.1 hypothetical protein [Klebsiella michiganensis]MDU6353915.1 hypothetical protein [Klebsiella grimontii]MDU6527098.1 hypothetical protein [Klebsiella grimontii]MDU7684768.1 hypothetical protein [Klebsiella grimontii]